MSTSPELILDDLRQRIAHREAVLIIGAGISIAATGHAPTASWKGLLENGIDRCVSLHVLDFPNAQNLKRQLDSSDTDLWLSAAQIVEKKLKSRCGEFALWLHDIVGSLKTTNREIVDALTQLNVPLFTTNYDGILEEVTSSPTVTWRTRSEFERVLRNELQAIVHLHGHYGDPESVVLGVSSYEEIVRDEWAQSMLRALRSTRTLVFVGFGKGLTDPNFSALFRWSRIFAESPYRQFRLARQSECEDVQAEHDAEERVFVIPYGTEHADLIPFLRSLAPAAGDATVHVPAPVVLSPADAFRRSEDSFHAEIDLAKQHTASGEPDVAIALLEKLRTRHSHEFTSRIWFRVLANIGHAYEEKEEWDKAASLYFQARDYDPTNVDAQCFEAVAHFLRGDSTKAFALAEQLKRDHPQSTLAIAVWIRSAPLAMSQAELENGAPEHLRNSQDIAHALMFAASRHLSFEKAEAYGRTALAVEPDSPMLVEHLGSALLDHAAYELRDIDAEVPPLSARTLAQSAIDAFVRALELRGQRGPAKTRARLYMRLAMANEIVGRREERDRCVRLAYDIDSSNPEIISRFAMYLADHNEFTAAIALLNGLHSSDGSAHVAFMLANLYLSRNHNGDRDIAQQFFLTLVPRLDSLTRQAQYQCVRNLLVAYAKTGQETEAETLFAQLPEAGFPPVAIHTLRSVFLRHLGRSGAANSEALEAAAMATQAGELSFRQALARELTILQLYGEALILWKDLVTPEYLGRDIHMAVASAVQSDSADFTLDFCAQLRRNGLYDQDCILSELEVLNRYNCVETIGGVIEEALENVEDENFRQLLRVNRSVIGLENSRPQWVTSDPLQLPSANAVPPHIGRAVVQILSPSDEPIRAVQYAYELLRRNIASKDANMAMIVAVLVGEKHGLKIAVTDSVVPGVAVAYKEETSPESQWWIIEDSPDPDRSRRELSPSHPLAEKLIGKKVGDTIVIRESPLQSRTAQVTDVKSKYVFRFQQCLREFEEYFPGESFLMQFTMKRAESGEPDLEPVFRSVNQRIEWIREIEGAYRKLLPSMNVFAQKTGTHVLDAAVHLASEPLPIRCCTASNAELNEALTALAGSETIVLDGSALATLFLCQGGQILKGLHPKPIISYGTLRGLRRLYMERLNSGGQGFLTKVGDQFVFREENAEERQKYLGEMSKFIEILETVAVVEEGRDFASIAKRTRDLIETGFGRAAGESVALASRDKSILWLDDLPLAQHGKSELNLKSVWTQAVLCREFDEGRLDRELFCALCLKLLRYRYTTTRLVPDIAYFAGEKGNWSIADPDLALIISWFGNTDVAPATLAWMASNVITHVIVEVHEQSNADQVIDSILREIASRHDGAKLLVEFRDSVDVNWQSIDIDRERLKSLIKNVIERS